MKAAALPCSARSSMQPRTEIRLIGYVGMLLLLVTTGVAGGRTSEERTGMVITTSVRNVSLSSVIVTGSLPGTAAITSTTLHALFQTIIMVLTELAWGRLTSAETTSVKMKAA